MIALSEKRETWNVVKIWDLEGIVDDVVNFNINT